MTNEERKFLISVKKGKPKWDLLGLTGVEDLPAVKWKLMNIDGVLESPIYCVAAVFQTLGRLHVLPRDLCKTALFEVCAYLSDFCVPDERDLRFASTGSNFNPRNTQCIPPVNPPQADRLS